MEDKIYKIDVDAKILELLGPNLYTNIYYVLSELIANAYDADAKNVYLIENEKGIIVEDDGNGMSYNKGEVENYLKVAKTSRTNEAEAITKLHRRKMGRKGVGKLAALSVSENVIIKTISNGEKSGFVLSRHINNNNLLEGISEENIKFEKISKNGTSIVMSKPQYKLHKTLKAVKNNLLKIFPMVDENFKIHIIRGEEEVVIDNFDKEIIGQLSTLIVLGDDFKHLKNYYSTDFTNKQRELLDMRKSYVEEIEMENNDKKIEKYNLEIKGWIGTYMSTRGRKASDTDFPDNFISIFANKKMGLFNLLPVVGKNKMTEVYIVGQIHVDILELTELPDIALSNRQGYKTDDIRYKKISSYVKNTLIEDILNMRKKYVDAKNEKNKIDLINLNKKKEAEFSRNIKKFNKETSSKASNEISELLDINSENTNRINIIIQKAINANSPKLEIKSEIDSSKKKLLISHTKKDKGLADVIFKMLCFNNIPPKYIIYSNCDDEKCRIPENYGIYNYLKDFFVNSYSTQKIYVIFITSENMNGSWGELSEIGASWITQMEHKIFTINGFNPKEPLNTQNTWHNTTIDEKGNLFMDYLDADIFCQKIENVCEKLGYTKNSREQNLKELNRLVEIKKN